MELAGESVVMVELRRADEDGVEGWRPLVQWVGSIPHALLTGATSAASFALAVLTGVLVVVTGRVPAWIVAFQTMTVRERVRTFGHFFVLRPDGPPVNLAVTANDPGDDPRVTVTVPAGARRTSRVEALARPFVLVPHLLVLLPIGLVMDACYPVWMLLVAANRGWPPSMARLLGAVEHWVGTLALYATFATDERPAFGLAAHGYRVGERPAGAEPA